MSDLRKNCNQGQQKQTLRISSPPRLLDRPKTPACLGLSIVHPLILAACYGPHRSIYIAD